MSGRMFLSYDLARTCAASFSAAASTTQAFTLMKNSVALKTLPRSEGMLARALPKKDRRLLNDKQLSKAVLRAQILDEIEYLPDEIAENVDLN